MRSFMSLKKEPVRIVAPKHVHSGHTSAGRNGSWGVLPISPHSRTCLRRISSPSIARARSVSKRRELLAARYAGGRGRRSSCSSVRSPPRRRNGVTHRYSAFPIKPLCAREENVVPGSPAPSPNSTPCPSSVGAPAAESPSCAYCCNPNLRNTLSASDAITGGVTRGGRPSSGTNEPPVRCARRAKCARRTRRSEIGCLHITRRRLVGGK